MKTKAIVVEKTQQLIKMTGRFCQEYLDEDYKQLCEKLIGKMSRKRVAASGNSGNASQAGKIERRNKMRTPRSKGDMNEV